MWSGLVYLAMLSNPDACQSARATAIELVRAVWAPRPTLSVDTTWFSVVGGGDPCSHECMREDCGTPCDLRKVSSACLFCAAEHNKGEEEKAAKKEQERQAAVEALDRVDQLCGVPR
jgi:hypothetical protein